LLSGTVTPTGYAEFDVEFGRHLDHVVPDERRSAAVTPCSLEPPEQLGEEGVSGFGEAGPGEARRLIAGWE